ncbi:MAG: MATE family efflux transporter [bacterium]
MTDPVTANEARLTRKPVALTLWQMSWPATIGLFSVIAFNIVDTLYIGRLGPDPLAAMGFCFPVIFSMGSLAIGLGIGGVTVISRAIGEGLEDRARRLMTNCITLLAAISLSLTGIMFLISDHIFALLGTPAHLMPYVNAYMHIWYAGLPFLIMPIGINNLIRAYGEARFPSIMMVVAAILNAILSPILIFGLFGLPPLDMAGAAWATIFARGIIGITGIIYVGFYRNMMEVSWRAVTALPRHIKEILRFSIPATLTQLVSPITTAIIVRMLSQFGDSAVAGFTVGARIETFVLIPFFAFQSGLSPFIGQNLGAGRSDRLQEAQKIIWIYSFLWGGLMFLLIHFFGAQLSGLFTTEQDIIHYADQYIGIVSFGFVFAGVFYAAMATFNPLGYPIFGALFSTGRYLFAYAGMAFVLIHGFLGEKFASPVGVYTAAVFAWIVGGIIGGSMMQYLISKKLSSSDLHSSNDYSTAASSESVASQPNAER